MDWTKFNLAAVNSKVGRKIGFNKQSVCKRGVGEGPQQEIIIWAIVHFVKGLAQDEYPSGHCSAVLEVSLQYPVCSN